MIYFIMLFLFASNVMAQTPEQLSEQNAFPDEIIAELHKENNAVTVLKNTSETKTVRIGVISSLLKRTDNPNLYDFAVSFDDGRVLTITQDNGFGLKPNDLVKTALEKGLTRILGKVAD